MAYMKDSSGRRLDTFKVGDADLGQFELQPMVAIGHSYIGAQNQTPNARLHERIASRLRMGAISNFGASGKYSRQVAMNTLGGTNKWVPRTRALFVGICTINDIQLHGDDTRAFTGYKNSWRALLSCVTANAAVAANSANFAYTSGWTKTPAGGLTDDCSTGGAYFTTSTVGEYFEFTFTGADADVFMVGKSVAAGVVEFKEGATVLGQLDMTTAQGMANTLMIFRIRGLSAGTHTIRGTLVSGASMTVDSYRIPAVQPVPGIVLGEGLVDRVAPGAIPYTTLLDRNKAALETIVAEFPSIEYVDASDGWDMGTMLREDGTHPNDIGCAHLADVALAALRGVTYKPGLNVLAAAEAAYVVPAGPSIPAGGYLGSDTPPITGGTFLDNFNRADSAVPGNLDTGQAWSIAGAGTTWGVTSGNMGAQTGGNSFLNVDTASADGTVLGIVGSITASNAGVGFRGTDEANMWYVAIGSGAGTNYVLTSRTSGTPTNVATSTVPATVGDFVEIVLAGTSIIVKVNGAEIMTYTSSTRLTATKHGFYGNGSLAAGSRWTAFRYTP